MKYFTLGLLFSGLGTNGAWILSTNEFPIAARVAGGVMLLLGFIGAWIYAEEYHD